MIKMLRLQGWNILFACLVLQFVFISHVQAIPLAHNNPFTPNTLIQHHLEGNGAQIRVGLADATNSTVFSDRVDMVLAEYNSVPGSSLSLTRGSNLSGSSSSCSVNAIENPSSDFMIYACPNAVFDSLGLVSNVQGATLTDSDDQGVIRSAIIIIRQGLDTATLTHVLIHEIGHMIGLDHTIFNDLVDLAAMFPLVLLPVDSLQADDIFSIQSNYPDSPGSPTSLFADGACVSGTIHNQDDLPVSNVIVIAHDANGGTSTQVVTTASGYGYSRNNQANQAGEFTVCAPATEITHIEVCTCDITLTDLNITVSCGADLEDYLSSQNQTQALGGDLSFMSQVLMPYEQDGQCYAYDSQGSIPLQANETAVDMGETLSLNPGDFRENLEIEVFAQMLTYNVFQPLTQGPFDGDSSGCSISTRVPGQYASMDLMLWLMTLLPIALLSMRKVSLARVKKS